MFTLHRVLFITVCTFLPLSSVVADCTVKSKVKSSASLICNGVNTLTCDTKSKTIKVNGKKISVACSLKKIKIDASKATKITVKGAIAASSILVDAKKSKKAITVDLSMATPFKAGAKSFASSNAFGATINGGSGDDMLTGTMGNDKMFGNGGDDQLNGGMGDDDQNGGAGDDQLNGGDGDDRCNGGDGDDDMRGGDGEDDYSSDEDGSDEYRDDNDFDFEFGDSPDKEFFNPDDEGFDDSNPEFQDDPFEGIGDECELFENEEGELEFDCGDDGFDDPEFQDDPNLEDPFQGQSVYF